MIIELRGKNKGFTTIDDEDYDKVSNYKWYLHPLGYVVGLTKGITNVKIHRLIMNCPKGKFIDHINGVRTDNRKSNLRICTQRENNRNRKIKAQGRGAFYEKDKNTWMAYTSHYGKDLNLGRFRTQRQALMARDIAAKDLHGEFAVLNFPNAIHGHPLTIADTESPNH